MRKNLRDRLNFRKKDPDNSTNFMELHPTLTNRLSLIKDFAGRHKGTIATGVAVAVASYIAFKTGDDWGTTYRWIEGTIIEEKPGTGISNWQIDVDVQDRGEGTGYPDSGINDDTFGDHWVVEYNDTETADTAELGFIKGGSSADAQYDEGDNIRINFVERNIHLHAISTLLRYAVPAFYCAAVIPELVVDKYFSWQEAREERINAEKEKEKQEKIKEHGINEDADLLETGDYNIDALAEDKPKIFSFGRISDAAPTASTAITGLVTIGLLGSGIYDLVTGDSSAAMDKFTVATGTGILAGISYKMRKYINHHSNNTFEEVITPDILDDDAEVEEILESMIKPAGTFKPTPNYHRNPISAE